MLHTPHSVSLQNEGELQHRPLGDAEWDFLEPFVIETPRRRGRPPRNHRRVLNGIFWVACSGSPWRNLPKEFGNWGSVYRQFLRWTRNGLWEAILEALENTAAASQRGQDDVFADIDRDYLSSLVEETRVVALRPRSTQGRSRSITF